MPIIEPSFTASLQLPDGSADEEFGGQHSATEGHLRVMEALEQHLHTRFADLLFMDANGGQRRIHQNSFFTIVKTDQANLVRHFHTAPGQRPPKAEGDFVVACYDGCGPRFLRQNSPYAFLPKIAESESALGCNQNRLQFVLSHCLPITFVSATKPGVGDVRGENNVAVPLADKVARRMKRPLKIIEADLIEVLLVAHSDHIVTESHERHVNGSDSLQQIRVNRAG